MGDESECVLMTQSQPYLDAVVRLLLVLARHPVLHALIRPQLHDAPAQRAGDGRGQRAAGGLEDLFLFLC